MTFNTETLQVNKLQTLLEKVIELQMTSEELDKVAKYVLNEECPFSFSINLSVDVTPIKAESAKTLDLDSVDMSNPKEFLKFIHNANDAMNEKETKKEKITLYLDSISNKTFLSMLEKLISDVNEELNTKSNLIKTNLK